MDAFREENLREFLAAMKGSGSTPSLKLLNAIKSLSGVSEKKIKAMVTEIFGQYPPDGGGSGTRSLFL